MSGIKKIIIIVSIALLISIAGYFLTRKGRQPSQSGTRTPLPQSQIPTSELNLPTGETMVINNTEIKNVYKNAIDINDVGDVVFSETDSSQLVYHPKDNFFLISILDSPFESARLAAEQQFLQSLEISESEACKLNVSVTTPRFANPEEAGRNYKLSFCK